MSEPFTISQEQKETFVRDGYLIIPNYFSKEKVIELRKEAERLLSEISLEGHPMTKFSTGSGKDVKHVGDEYFLTSGDKIRYFFEEEAFGSDGNLTRDPTKCINKIGHGLHIHNSIFREVTINKSNSAISKEISGKGNGSIGFKDPRALQSMLILKQPFIGGAVPPHQDSTFLYTNPQSAMGFWFALEDCMSNNGCLSFVKGSHKWSNGEVTKRFVRSKDTGTTFEERQDISLQENEQEYTWTMEECEAGTLVLIHGSLIHKSEANKSGRSRFIYTFHVIEGAYEYDERNWLQPSNNVPFTSLLV